MQLPVFLIKKTTFSFITIRKIDSFESLTKFMTDREQKYQELGKVYLSEGRN